MKRFENVKYFNGKRYYFFSNHKRKEFAVSAAKTKRQKGHLSRVIYNSTTGYYMMYATRTP